MAPPSRRPAPEPDLLRRLREDDLEVLGRMPWASNGTFLVQLCGPDDDGSDAADGDADEGGPADDDAGEGAHPPTPVRAVYKPERGERPLWDFPPGLFKREAAAYELGVALGWHVVPPTVVRDGPLGPGSLQLFVDADFEQHYFTLQEEEAHRHDFQAICAFDVLANNTDRKSGHCLLGQDGAIWAIDNGLCFAAEYKLRTVIWDFGGQPIPTDLLDDLSALQSRGLPPELTALLDAEEAEAVVERMDRLVDRGRFPQDGSGRRYPWPLV